MRGKDTWRKAAKKIIMQKFGRIVLSRNDKKKKSRKKKKHTVILVYTHHTVIYIFSIGQN